jgi:hypothetical protein
MDHEEIFRQIAARQVKGMMVHSLFADYYDFLGLEEYGKMHKHRFMDESKSYKRVCHFYTTHFNKLIRESRIDPPDIIPKDWYNYTRQDVDVSTKRSAVKVGLEQWINWEKETKELYESFCKETTDTLTHNLLCELAKDVSKELDNALSYQLRKKALDYSITEIMSEN